MITVLGATGHTGGKIARALLEAGENVRALGRSEAKLASLRSAGADALAGDATDHAFLTRAFHGSEAVYVLVSPDPQSVDYCAAQDALGHSIVAAIRASGVRHVVALSSLGTDLEMASGVIMGLRAQEKRLERLERTNVLILRPASFFENFENMLGLIKEHGICGDSIVRDLMIPMVGTRDIADVATKALRARDWTGVVVRELLGPRDISFAEASRLLGIRIGRPELAYVQFSDEDMIGALVGAGYSRSFAMLYVEMTRAINADALQPTQGRTSENTTPTRFEDFADELASAFAMM